VGFSQQVDCFFGKGERTFENEHAKQSVVGNSVARFERVKSYRTSRGGFCPPSIFAEKETCSQTGV
jgi:hypothetical protein